jgi:hypothetical protein
MGSTAKEYDFEHPALVTQASYLEHPEWIKADGRVVSKDEVANGEDATTIFRLTGPVKKLTTSGFVGEKCTVMASSMFDTYIAANLTIDTFSSIDILQNGHQWISMASEVDQEEWISIGFSNTSIIDHLEYIPACGIPEILGIRLPCPRDLSIYGKTKDDEDYTFIKKFTNLPMRDIFQDSSPIKLDISKYKKSVDAIKIVINHWHPGEDSQAEGHVLHGGLKRLWVYGYRPNSIQIPLLASAGEGYCWVFKPKVIEEKKESVKPTKKSTKSSKKVKDVEQETTNKAMEVPVIGSIVFMSRPPVDASMGTWLPMNQEHNLSQADYPELFECISHSYAREHNLSKLQNWCYSKISPINICLTQINLAAFFSDIRNFSKQMKFDISVELVDISKDQILVSQVTKNTTADEVFQHRIGQFELPKDIWETPIGGYCFFQTKKLKSSLSVVRKPDKVTRFMQSTSPIVLVVQFVIHKPWTISSMLSKVKVLLSDHSLERYVRVSWHEEGYFTLQPAFDRFAQMRPSWAASPLSSTSPQSISLTPYIRVK